MDIRTATAMMTVNKIANEAPDLDTFLDTVEEDPEILAVYHSVLLRSYSMLETCTGLKTRYVGHCSNTTSELYREGTGKVVGTYSNEEYAKAAWTYCKEKTDTEHIASLLAWWMLEHADRSKVS